MENQLIFEPQIIHLLTELLYPEPKMAIREVLANAADALSEAVSLGVLQSSDAAIVVKTDWNAGILTIEDNGIGLTPDDANVLNRVGADVDKRQRFEQRLNSTANAGDLKAELATLIGRYGIGRLAALCVADKVVLESKSRTGDGVRWSMQSGDTRTETTTIHRTRRGTSLSLFVKDAFREQLLLEDHLEPILKEYGGLLPFRICLRDPASDPINIPRPVLYEPVAQGFRPTPIRYVSVVDRQQVTEREKKYLDLWDKLYRDLGVGKPLAILPLSHPRTKYVQGMLFIPASQSFPEMGRVRLWCRRMFVKSNEDDLLPTWAKPFLSGIVDCQADPNLARTDLLRTDDNHYPQIKAELEREIAGQIGALSEPGEPLWETMLALYRPWLIQAANISEDLLKRIAERTTFRRAIRSKDAEIATWITLEDYERQMERRRGDDTELPIGNAVGALDDADLERHRRTVYYYTGEGTLAGVIDRHTILHVENTNEIEFLRKWCLLQDLRLMNVGQELPFATAPKWYFFAELVKDAIGHDVRQRNLQVRPVSIAHRPELPCILTSENPDQAKLEQYTREINEMPDDEFQMMVRQLSSGPVKLDQLTRSQVTEGLAQARVLHEKNEKAPEALLSRSADVLYLNMANELLLHLADDRRFETQDEREFRLKLLHELWHVAKVARGEALDARNAEHHFETAVSFLERVVDRYEKGREAEKELSRRKQEQYDLRQE